MTEGLIKYKGVEVVTELAGLADQALEPSRLHTSEVDVGPAPQQEVPLPLGPNLQVVVGRHSLGLPRSDLPAANSRPSKTTPTLFVSGSCG